MHLVSVRGAFPTLLFGASEVFCSARFLINGRTIRRDAVDEVEYFHILLEAHQVIRAEGCDSESLYPGPVGLASFDPEAQQEIFGLFPELRSLPTGYGAAARRILKAHEAAVLASLVAPARAAHPA